MSFFNKKILLVSLLCLKTTSALFSMEDSSSSSQIIQDDSPICLTEHSDNKLIATTSAGETFYVVPSDSNIGYLVDEHGERVIAGDLEGGDKSQVIILGHVRESGNNTDSSAIEASVDQEEKKDSTTRNPVSYRPPAPQNNSNGRGGIRQGERYHAPRPTAEPTKFNVVKDLWNWLTGKTKRKKREAERIANEVAKEEAEMAAEQARKIEEQNKAKEAKKKEEQRRAEKERLEQEQQKKEEKRRQFQEERKKEREWSKKELEKRREWLRKFEKDKIARIEEQHKKDREKVAKEKTERETLSQLEARKKLEKRRQKAKRKNLDQDEPPVEKKAKKDLDDHSEDNVETPLQSIESSSTTTTDRESLILEKDNEEKVADKIIGTQLEAQKKSEERRQKAKRKKLDQDEPPVEKKAKSDLGDQAKDKVGIPLQSTESSNATISDRESSNTEKRQLSKEQLEVLHKFEQKFEKVMEEKLQGFVADVALDYHRRDRERRRRLEWLKSVQPKSPFSVSPFDRKLADGGQQIIMDLNEDIDMEDAEPIILNPQSEISELISITEGNISQTKALLGASPHLDLTQTTAKQFTSMAKYYSKKGDLQTAKMAAKISNIISKVGKGSAYLFRGLKRLGAGVDRFSKESCKILDQIIMNPEKAIGQFAEHLKQSSLALAQLSLELLFLPERSCDRLKAGIDTFADKVSNMSKGELVENGAYVFMHLISIAVAAYDPIMLASTGGNISSQEVAAFAQVAKNINLVLKNEFVLAKELIREHKFLEKFERALTPVRTTLLDGVEVMAISLGCGKEGAKRVVEILKKNPEIMKLEIRGGWLKENIPLSAVYKELIGIAPEIMPKQNLKHLFLGEIKAGRNGLVLKGFHHARSYPERISKVIIAPNKHGIYLAKYVFNGLEKESTFFPNHWDRFTVLKKVSEAYKNPVKFYNNGIMGVTSEGIEIQIWFKKDIEMGELIINSAYPSKNQLLGG